MTSAYQKKFAMPEGFPMVLKDFTREVLRADLQDPAGIYEFGARYFSQMASGEGGGAASRLNAEELHAKIKGLFAQADADGNGYLDASEFKGVFTGLAAELGLSEFHIRQIMAEADENGDGVIEYSEFVQLAVDMIETMFARQDARDAQDAAQEEAQYRAEDMLLHGMSKEELDGVLIGIFQDADEDKSGFLTRQQFFNCLRNTDLGLSRKEINALMAEADANADGKITYEEFMPLCYQILVEIVSEEVKKEAIPTNLAQVTDFFKDLFRSADTQDEGVLHYQDIMELMRQAELGLSTMQIHMMMAEGEQDDEGYVNYAEYADSAAGVYVNMMDLGRHAEFSSKVAQLRQESEANVAGMDRNGLASALQAAFANEDQEATGALPRATVRQCIASSVPGLTGQQINLLLSYAAVDPSTNTVRKSGERKGANGEKEARPAACPFSPLVLHTCFVYSWSHSWSVVSPT